MFSGKQKKKEKSISLPPKSVEQMTYVFFNLLEASTVS